MVAELERRGISVVAFVSHVSGRHYIPSADVPSEDREKCYGNSFASKHPLNMAFFLCRGIQCCLDDLSRRVDDPRVDESIIALSRQLHHVQEDMEFWLKRFKTG
jgi:hypothetical protein